MPVRDEWRIQYLRVIGRLYPGGRLRLRPCYLTNAAPPADRASESPLVVELLDETGELLGRHPLGIYSTCRVGGHGADAVRGWIPFHPRARTLRFRNCGRVALEIRRPERDPEIRLTWRPQGRVEGRQRITWEASSPESAPLQFFLRYSNDGGRRYQRVEWRTEDREALVDFNELPGGDRCLLAVVVTDGINTVIAESEPFAVEPKPCQAFVIAPVDGSAFAAGEPVQFLGQGYWIEDRRVERESLRWTSSVDGDLGRGSRVVADRLSEGEHRITLVAGEEGREGTESVTIRVESRSDS